MLPSSSKVMIHSRTFLIVLWNHQKFGEKTLPNRLFLKRIFRCKAKKCYCVEICVKTKNQFNWTLSLTNSVVNDVYLWGWFLNAKYCGRRLMRWWIIESQPSIVIRSKWSLTIHKNYLLMLLLFITFMLAHSDSIKQWLRYFIPIL